MDDGKYELRKSKISLPVAEWNILDPGRRMFGITGVDEESKRKLIMAFVRDICKELDLKIPMDIHHVIKAFYDCQLLHFIQIVDTYNRESNDIQSCHHMISVLDILN